MCARCSLALHLSGLRDIYIYIYSTKVNQDLHLSGLALNYIIIRNILTWRDGNSDAASLAGEASRRVSPRSTAFPTLRLVPAPADMHPYRVPSYALIEGQCQRHDAKTTSIHNMGLMSLGSWRETISLFYSDPTCPPPLP